MTQSKLALLGGAPVVPEGMISPEDHDRLFKAMILTKEAEDAALDVIRKGTFSDTDITE